MGNLYFLYTLVLGVLSFYEMVFKLIYVTIKSLNVEGGEKTEESK
jgi:hypothetical protein